MTVRAQVGPPCLTPNGLRLRYSRFPPSPQQAAFLAMTGPDVLFGGMVAGGKRCELSTPILTGEGWSTIGALQVGDRVYDENGELTEVVAKSPVDYQPAYVVRMADGEEVVACDEHLWNVSTERQRSAYRGTDPEVKARRRAKRRGLSVDEVAPLRCVSGERPSVWDYTTTMTTAEVLRLMQTERQRVAIPNAAALHTGGEWRSAIPAYTLGVWLGSGRRCHSYITVRESDLSAMTTELEADGWTVHQLQTWPGREDHALRLVDRDGVSLHTHLHQEGFLRCHHVPEWVVEAPLADRQAFLGGFCDSNVDPERGRGVKFRLADEATARAVWSLVWSIGEKPTTAVCQAADAWGFRLDDCKTDLFRMPRDYLTLPYRRRPAWRQIDSITPCGVMPMQCITVASPRGLFRVGRSFLTTHNSLTLLLAALQFSDVPGYNALLLRRTLQDLKLPDSLIPMSKWLLEGKGPTYNANDYIWTFPSGATLQFGYLRSPGDELRYQGTQFQFCVERSTPIRMADGSTKRIDAIRVGDEVATLVGPRRVQRTYDVGVKPAVRMTTRIGEVVCSPDHPVLMSDGSWVDPAALPPSEDRLTGTSSAGCSESLPVRGPLGGYSSPDPPQVPSAAPQVLVPAAHRGCDVCGSDQGTCCGESCDARRGASLPPPWIDSPTLQLPAPASAGLVGSGEIHRRAPAREQCGSSFRGCQGGCVPGDGRDGGRFRRVPVVVPEHTPSPVGVGEPILAAIEGGPLRTPVCSRSGSAMFVHPYTMELVAPEVRYEAPAGTRTVPVGDAYLWDIQVEGASHYISVSGLVHANCGFDELTQFPDRDQVRYLFSRMRRLKLPRAQLLSEVGMSPDGLTIADIPLRFRGATNPGGPGQWWVKEDYVDPATAIAPFLRSSFRDNPGVDDAEIQSMLAGLSEVERRRLELGDWDVTEVPGALWRFSDIVHVDEVGVFDTIVMGVDGAVSEGTGDEAGIVVVGKRRDGVVVVLEDASLRAHPDDWSKRAVTSYHHWGCSRLVVETNQGGVFNSMILKNAADVLGVDRPNIIEVRAKPGESKEVRAQPVAQAYRARKVVHGPEVRDSRLEAQMVSWVPGSRLSVSGSPDRVDALVWAVQHALFGVGVSAARPSGVRRQLASWG